MIYQKANYIPLTHNRYEQSFEYMFCFTKGKPKTFNPIKIPCKGAGKIETRGTTGKMAVKNKRNFIGVEIVESYFNIAEKRIKDEKDLQITK